MAEPTANIPFMQKPDAAERSSGAIDSFEKTR